MLNASRHDTTCTTAALFVIWGSDETELISKVEVYEIASLGRRDVGWNVRGGLVDRFPYFSQDPVGENRPQIDVFPSAHYEASILHFWVFSLWKLLSPLPLTLRRFLSRSPLTTRLTSFGSVAGVRATTRLVRQEHVKLNALRSKLSSLRRNTGTPETLSDACDTRVLWA